MSGPDEEAAVYLLMSSHVLRRQLQDVTVATTLELVKNVFLILWIGISTVLGMAILAYLMSVFVDKCFHDDDGGGGGSGMTNQNNGTGTGTVTGTPSSVVQKAGLMGLRPNERRLILEHIFKKTASTFHVKDYPKDDTNDDMDTTGPTAQSETTTTTSQETPPPPPTAPQQEQQEEPYKSTTTNNENTTSNSNNVVTSGTTTTKNNDVNGDAAIIITDDINHEHECCICLSTYQENCLVLTCKSCRHAFHYKCAMDWLDRHEHEHCPYCRKEMMSAEELRRSAIQLLGQERVREIAMWQGQRNDYYNMAITTTTPLSASSSSTTPAAAAAVRSGMATVTTTTTTSNFTEGGDIDEGGNGSNHDSSAEIRV